MTHLPQLTFDPSTGRLSDKGSDYDHLDLCFSVSEHIEYLRHLKNERDGRPYFFHQPWEQIRKLYRDLGDTDAVCQINMAYDTAMAQFDFKMAGPMFKPFIGLRNVLYDKLAGYGHNLFRVVPWILICMVLFLAWSSFSYHQGSIAPTAPHVYMNTCYLNIDTPCKGWEYHTRAVMFPDIFNTVPNPLRDTPVLQLPGGYPGFHSILYTLDTFIPFANLQQEEYWTIIDDGPWGEVTRMIFSVFISLGSVLSTIFAAAMLSLIRKN